MIGFAAIVLASTGLGFLLSADLGRRVRELSQAQALMREIGTHMRYFSSPVMEMVGKLSSREDFSALPFLRECEQRYEKCHNFDEAMAQALASRAQDMHMKKSDIDILASFFRGMGTTDTQGQIANCELHEVQLETALHAARERQKTHGRLYRTLGLLSGIMVCILLY